LETLLSLVSQPFSGFIWSGPSQRRIRVNTLQQTRTVRLLLIAIAVSLPLFSKPAIAQELRTTPTPPRSPPATAPVPGVIIDHSAASSGLYIGSPGITALTNGDYLASHDFFGPSSKEFDCPLTLVFRSRDRGAHWEKVATLNCLFWASLFGREGVAYLMGTDKHHGRIVLRRSLDGGMTWTEPRDSFTGLLTQVGEYHTAPVPVVEHEGRLWRAFEDASGGTKWGERYQAGVLSAPVGADLLVATNWLFTPFLAGNPAWLAHGFGGWLEGNVAVAPGGQVVNLLRVDTPSLPEKIALIKVQNQGHNVEFVPPTGFIDFPGGAKKFTIRQDPQDGLYWSLVSIADTNRDRIPISGRPASIRNTLALVSSPDLLRWETRTTLLHHPDALRHGFQYVDWQFENDDLIAVCRTAFDDGEGGAHTAHDANFLTFHRIPMFRTLGRSTQSNPSQENPVK
jgi:hypothetical protein